MKQDDIDSICFKIDSEGFDYALTEYSSWEEIKDEKFHELLKAYRDAKHSLESYIDFEGWCEDQADEEAEDEEIDRKLEEKYKST